MATPYDRGYFDGLRNHTGFFRPDPRYTPENRGAYVRGYTEAQERAHEAELPEQRRLAALNLPRGQR